MDVLQAVIDTLSKEDRKEFTSFLGRHRERKERKDLELFRILASGNKTKREDILKVLYPGDLKVEAYHATRKRLLKQLMEFMQWKKIRNESSAEGYIDQLIHMSVHLFEMAREEAGWSLLQQAGELARKGESYKTLNSIYALQILYSHTENAPDLKEILLQKKKYQALAVEEDNAHTAYHLIRYELNKSLSTGKEIDIAKTIKKVLKEYQLTQAAADRPALLYNIMAITRSAVLAGKDFYHFEPYIIEKYQEAEERGSFNKYNHYAKVNLLYMIAHVLYRNKKFRECSTYLERLYESLLEYNKGQYASLFPKYMLLKAAVMNYTGRNKDAIEMLEKLTGDRSARLDKVQLLNTYLNLSIYYFQKEDYRKSIRVFRHVQHSDKWLTRVMGFEWVMKKHIVECINQFELGNSDLVEQRLDLIGRNYAEYFQRPMYQRVKVFLSLVRALNQDPVRAVSKEFHAKVESSFEFMESSREDIQAMSFYGWLKAKMTGRKYYQVLLELVHRGE